ncbi:MAG: hypothetical protein AAAC48_03685, partial [Phyllobacterium sp.]
MADAPERLKGKERPSPYQSAAMAENISIECRSAGKHDSGLAAAAADLVQLPVDVIVTSSQPAA